MDTKNSTTSRLDIFRVLRAANKKDLSFFDNLTPEEQKQFYPVLAMRWMSGTSNACQLVSINEFVNPYVYTLSSHKQLLWLLLTVANAGVQQQSQWIKPPGRAQSPKPLSTLLIQKQYGYNNARAIEALTLLTVDDMLEIGANHGCQPDELAKIKKEWKP